jgi:pimeloyl-ACP methyl ester carboxylesterase
MRNPSDQRRPATDEERYRAAERDLWQSLGARPTERRLDLRQHHVTVRLQELGDGEPVVFIHGANTSGASWASLASRLDGFRSIIVDRPGTGLSRPLVPALDRRSIGRFADTFVVDLLDALELERAHLVATSFGGFIALRSVAAHPDRVNRMVQFSWPAGAPNSRLPAFVRIMSIPVLGRLLAELPANERTVRMAFGRIGHEASLDTGRITEQDLACYLALLRHTDTMRNELALGRALISPLRGLNRVVLTDELLATVRTPTLFLWGENDPFGGVESARRVVGQMAGAELEMLAGAGHAPWLDDLDRCVGATAAFLAR